MDHGAIAEAPRRVAQTIARGSNDLSPEAPEDRQGGQALATSIALRPNGALQQRLHRHATRDTWEICARHRHSAADGDQVGERRQPFPVKFARLAPVPQPAVSRTCASAARAKIPAAVEPWAYSPNLLSRSHPAGRSGIVAVAVGGLSNPLHAAALERFAGGLRRARGRSPPLERASRRRAGLR